jgi:hypothetical protein
MKLINHISTQPLQQQTLILDNGQTFTLTIEYKPNQIGWFIRQITYNDTFTVNGLRITNFPNILQPWVNLIPFGLGCFSKQNREPMLQEDFQSGNSKLYVLSESEKDEVTAYIRNG